MGQYLRWDCRSPKVMKANRHNDTNNRRQLSKKYVRNVIRSSKEVILEEMNHVVNDIEVIQRNEKNSQNVKANFYIGLGRKDRFDYI